MAHARVLDQLRLLAAVEDERVVVLPHEEVVHAPLVLLYDARQLAVVVFLEREVYALALQLTVGGEIEEEVVKQLIGCLGHGLLGYHAVLWRQRVGRHGVCHRNGVFLRGLLVGTAYVERGNRRQEQHQYE